MTNVLEAVGVEKRYGGTVALRGVDFAVRSHAVKVLIGENGAGKSTLMRILAGIEQPTSGTLLLDGRETRFGSVRDAAAQGIGIIHQELNLCPNLSVADNIFLAQPKRAGGLTVDRAEEKEVVRAILARLDQAIDPETLVQDLAVGQQQMVEIAKALVADARILIMDEPTSALSAHEVDVLFSVIAELRRAGVAIVYISHRLEELLRIGDDITVLRDGAVVAEARADQVTIGWIVEQMLGETGKLRHEGGPGERGAAVLEARNLSVARRGGGRLVDDVSAIFHAGEITAIYGLLGSGRTELLESICGARAATGKVVLDGTDISRLSLAERVERRLLLVPEDRQRAGLFTNLTVGGNLGLSSLRRFVRSGAISARLEMTAITGMMRRMAVKARSPAAWIGALSGGNQQKVVIGRCLMPGPAAILLDEPSRGVDVGARAENFAIMRRLADEGMAVVFATSDVSEALEVADRVLVMAGGRITADCSAREAGAAMLVTAANPGRSAPATPPELERVSG